MVPADEETKMDRREGKRTEDREADGLSDARGGRTGSTGGGQPAEDRAMKETARLFGKELMTRLGVNGRMLRIAPTEEIWLGSKRFDQDFNYEMEDKSWVHLEFESDQITVKDLRRFRAYEAVTSYHHGVEVVSYVLCSSRVKILKDKLENGSNVYRIQTIRIKDKEADEIICRLEERQQEGRLSREGLLELLLTPLMSGRMPYPERIIRGMRILKEESPYLEKDDLIQMESVLYTLALKFLTVEEMKMVKEAIGMTILGQMLVQDGIEKGILRGRIEGRAEGKAEDILDLLSEIGGVPAELAARIKCEQDDGTLRRWLRSAARADSVEQFEQMM